MFIIFAFSFSEWVSILPVSEAPGLVAAGEDRPGSAELSVSGRSAPQVGGTAGPGSVERKLGRKWRRLRGTRVRTTLGRIVSWLKGGCSDEAHLQSRAEERRGEVGGGEERRVEREFQLRRKLVWRWRLFKTRERELQKGRGLLSCRRSLWWFFHFWRG